MSKSLFVEEYNRANIEDKKLKTFTQTIKVGFLDVLKSNEIEVVVKDYLDCDCKNSTNIKDYFIECSKCGAKGVISLNHHEVVCNECKGEKYIRIHDCYVCNNSNKVLKNTKIKIKLDSTMKNDDLIEYSFSDHKLVLKINIYDQDNYLIKDKDIYLLKSIKYSKEDFQNKVLKEIKTYNGIRKVKSDFKVKREVVILDEEGIDGGNFYFVFENEVVNNKKIIYTNVLIDNKGYVKIRDLIEEKIVVAKRNIALNQNGYLYIDDSVTQYENDDYVIYFNKFDLNDFEVSDGYSYVVKLDQEDSNNDKKNILINGDRVNINYKKNLKEPLYINVDNKGFVNKENKKEGIVIKVVPYFKNIYKIAIKKNKKTVYVEDYKYDDYTLVETFNKDDYLQDYIEINKEDRVYVNNDVVLIKRV